MTFKATLKNRGSGCDFSIIMVGDTEKEAIIDYFERKEDVGTVYSITRPYDPDTYHVEHSGRDIQIYRSGAPQTVTTFSDDIVNIIPLEEVK